MSFTDAVRKVLSNYVTFTGRASRSEYWWWVLAYVLAMLVAAAIDAMLGIDLVQLIFGLGLFLPSLAVAVRRLHDTGRSGWWVLLGLIPIVGALVLIWFYIQPSVAGANDHGPEPDESAALRAA